MLPYNSGSFVTMMLHETSNKSIILHRRVLGSQKGPKYRRGIVLALNQFKLQPSIDDDRLTIL